MEIVCDDGYSAKSLDRPGIKRALAMLTEKRVNAIVVVKLDRLTRSVKDLGFLCDTYFREGMPHSLLSVSDAIDTRSASGKLMLNVLMSVAQWEREAISERTQEAMNELKRRGVRLPARLRMDFTTRRKQTRTDGGIWCGIPSNSATSIASVICTAQDCLSWISRSADQRWSHTTERPVGTPDHLSDFGACRTPQTATETQDGFRSHTFGKEAWEVRTNAGQSSGDCACARTAETGTESAPDCRSSYKGTNPPVRTDVWHAASILDLLRQPIPSARNE